MGPHLAALDLVQGRGREGMGGTRIPAVASPSCCPVTTDCWWGQTSVSERVDRWTDHGQTVHLLPSTSASLSAKQRTRQGHILTGSRNGHRGRLLLGSSPASLGSRAGPRAAAPPRSSGGSAAAQRAPSAASPAPHPWVCASGRSRPNGSWPHGYGCHRGGGSYLL